LTSTDATQITPYEDVNAVLQLLLAKTQAILGKQMVGLYLYGSLSLGDFDPASSDVDFLVVTGERLPEVMLEQLREMHAEIAACGLPYARSLEGSYIPRDALWRYDPANNEHPTIGSDWPFQIGKHGPQWIIERQIVREYGVTVWGPSPRALIEAISPDELRAAVCAALKNFWQTQLDNPEWLRPRHYQAFAVLTLCRALYTLHHGAVSSKPRAAAWAQEAYPEWRPVIERALVWRSQHEADEDLSETLTFLREALGHAQVMCQ
jgi:aminoglycoside adenylyltransferase-like protein/nucleotidyltransferase-like protein